MFGGAGVLSDVNRHTTMVTLPAFLLLVIGRSNYRRFHTQQGNASDVVGKNKFFFTAVTTGIYCTYVMS